ncbi:MAG: outer membrane beta-barrel protein [Gammaproteobacteria bacterium]|nr:outer membrane beta-barrel protein [Gammaproteobacteria bacterium]MCD8542175.1 outer membrane beta-barrel protein [Gammaproteobacteria bacterium]
MKSRLSVVFLCLSCGVVSAAMADWSGLYIGPQLSYTWSNTQWQLAQPSTSSDSAYSGVATYPNGWTLGPHAGWKYQWGAWVLGLEGSYTSGSWSDDVSSENASDDRYKTKVSQMATITPIIGFADENWLFYVKGGYASGKVDVDVNTADQDTTFSDSDWQKGWTAGVGFQYQISGKNALGIEYNFSRLNSASFDGVDVEPINMNTLSLVYTRYLW